MSFAFSGCGRDSIFVVVVTGLGFVWRDGFHAVRRSAAGHGAADDVLLRGIVHRMANFVASEWLMALSQGRGCVCHRAL